jgi:polysaccharide biosynthesis/export protein
MVKTGRGKSGPRACAAAMLCFALAGCGLPASAPTASQLEGSINEAGQPFATPVNVDERVAAILHQYQKRSFGAQFKGGRYAPSNVLHPGDSISITIYEAGGATLMPAQGPASAGATTPVGPALSGASSVPPQVIEGDGTIMVPFVGRVRVAGKTPGQIGTDIARQLQGKAVEPQVVVSLTGNATNTATVGGDVGSPRPVPLSLRGERLLDVVAGAGGAKYPAYETYVSVVRRGKIGTVLLQTVVTNPRENIIIRPNDQVFLTRHPRTFAVLGATQKVSQYTFDTPRVTLAEAVARAGGPIDTVGDPSGVYLFRYEPIYIAEKILGRPVAATAAASDGSVADVPRDYVPILYRINFRTVGGYFLSQDIQIQDKDVVLVTNAEATQLVKLLTVIRGFTGIAYDLTRNAAGR